MPSISDNSSALSDLNEDADEDDATEQAPTTKKEKNRLVPGGRRGHDEFSSLIDNW